MTWIAAYEAILSLPMYPGRTDDQVARVVSTLEEALK
jgi:dTDP-4-amino-4,6-dideoxygalactose transaminase